jgi:hypothetical protein
MCSVLLVNHPKEWIMATGQDCVSEVTKVGLWPPAEPESPSFWRQRRLSICTP